MSVNFIQVAIRSDVGRVRRQNEDSINCAPEHGVLVLADGMGGHRAGEIASRLAVDVAANALVPAQQEDAADDVESQLRLGQAVESANKAIIEAARRNDALRGMGTTLVAAIFRNHRVFYAHVGDSRFYRVRAGRIRALTRDHSLVQELVDSGLFINRSEAKAAGVGANVLTRSLGMSGEVDVDMGDALLQEGDIYLACSDGLTGMLSDHQMARMLRYPDGDLEGMADDLLQAALDAGGNDNVSLILARPIPPV